MEKLYIQMLGMVVTEECNMNCRHCLRGDKTKHKMTDEVIESTLSQVDAIGNLAICGGEPTLATDVIWKIFDTIIRKQIIVDGVSAIINGLYYSKDFIEQFEYIEQYLDLISRNKEEVHAIFNISQDKFHEEEVKRYNMNELYYKNIEMYKRSPHFGEMQGIWSGLISEGNAVNLLDEDIKMFVPSILYSTNINGMVNIGNLVTIDTYGNITECDASIDEQQGKYRYGNVMNDSLKEVCLKRSKHLNNEEWYKKCASKKRTYI